MKPIDLFDALIHAEDEAEVDRILKQAGFGLDNEAAWRPLGDKENNFSTVGNQQSEATAALVEKLINGIDAVLMAECFRRGIDPEGSQAPTSMAEAVERFFHVKDWRRSRNSAAFGSRFARSSAGLNGRRPSARKHAGPRMMGGVRQMLGQS